MTKRKEIMMLELRKKALGKQLIEEIGQQFTTSYLPRTKLETLQKSNLVFTQQLAQPDERYNSSLGGFLYNRGKVNGYEWI